MKRCAIIVLCVLLAALTSIAVAWGFAAVQSLEQRAAMPRDWLEIDSKGVLYYFSEQQFAGVRRCFGSEYETDPQQIASMLETQKENGGGPPLLHWLPAVAPIRSGTAYGWPVVCAWHAEYVESSGTGVAFKYPGGMELPFGKGNGFPPRGRVLPLRPYWVGLVINTVLYTAIWTVVILVLSGWVRRRRARRAGVCEKCSYDLRGIAPDAPCPECGRSRYIRLVTAPA